MQSFSDLIRSTVAVQQAVAVLQQTGVQGPPGEPGVAGAKGNTGVPGDKGATGSRGVAGPKGDPGNDGVSDPNVLILATRAELQAVTPDPAKIAVVEGDVWTYTNDPADDFSAAADLDRHVFVRPAGQDLPAWKRRVSRYTPEHFGAVGFAECADALQAGISATEAIARGIAVASRSLTPFHFPPRAYALGGPVEISEKANITADAAAHICSLPSAGHAFRILETIATPMQFPSIMGFDGAAIEISARLGETVTATVTAHDIKTCGAAVILIGTAFAAVHVKNVTSVDTFVTYEQGTHDAVVTAQQLADVGTVAKFPDSTIDVSQANNSLSVRSAIDVGRFIHCLQPDPVGRFSATVDGQLTFKDPAAAGTYLIDGGFKPLMIKARVDGLLSKHVKTEVATLANLYAQLTSPAADPSVQASPQIDPDAAAVFQTTLNVAFTPDSTFSPGQTVQAYIKHVLGGRRWNAACTSDHAVTVKVLNGINGVVKISLTNVGASDLGPQNPISLFMERR